MKIALLVVCGVIVAIVILVAWLRFKVIVGDRRRAKELVAEILPVIQTLRNGDPPPTELIAKLAARQDTRGGLYQALHELGRPSLFPEQYSEIHKIAESHLVVWLLHPNELRSAPDEIQLAEVFEREEGDPPRKCRFFVFKFRTHPPHWAAEDGWMAGVAGPYWDGEKPLHSPGGVFSELESFDAFSPEEHLERLKVT
jgi:hypothetical protein